MNARKVRLQMSVMKARLPWDSPMAPAGTRLRMPVQVPEKIAVGTYPSQSAFMTGKSAPHLRDIPHDCLSRCTWVVKTKADKSVSWHLKYVSRLCWRHTELLASQPGTRPGR